METTVGGEFWTDGYYASAVGKHGDENMIGKYVKKQGNECSKSYQSRATCALLIPGCLRRGILFRKFIEELI